MTDGPLTVHPDDVTLEHMQVLRLQPSDVLALVTEHPLTEQAVARIRQQFAELFPNNRSVVVEQAKLAVLRPDERGSIEDQTTEDLT